MSDVDGYEAWNPRRLCDTCGDLYRLSQMSRLPGGVWSCNDKCRGERTATELSRANARQKQFRYRPVRNSKPEDPFNPDTFEADDGEILNFVGRMVASGTRFESVASGTHAPLSGNLLDGLSWAAIYLYGLIADNKLGASTIARAKTLLNSIAPQLIALQRGFGLVPTATAATDSFYGGFRAGGNWQTVDTATCGLALLYAYRVLGTTSYLTSARAAANYLRNVQAIGSNGTNFTSSDSAGTARLYTGSLASQVNNAASFTCNHIYRPSALLALWFWKELLTTDGDQNIGTTGTPTGFTSACSQLLSRSIADLRACWANGITESTGTLTNGLSATTPREFFNAYPASKPLFGLTGTGRWEFSDGDASTGTTLTAQQIGFAMWALYNYEGASSKVAEVDDWLRSFTSNPAFETPANQAPSVTARATTGTYDPTLTLATTLTVRDSTNGYASISLNGSSVYDWGIFGLLSPLWSARHTSTFAEARRSACGRNYRYADGNRSDGDYIDRISLRGLSGLSYQTALDNGNGVVNDVLRSAQFGFSFRQSPRSTTAPAH